MKGVLERELKVGNERFGVQMFSTNAHCCFDDLLVGKQSVQDWGEFTRFAYSKMFVAKVD
jgi:hypothetical protein